MLKKHFWFRFQDGGIFEFGSPDNWFDEAATRTDWPLYNKNCLNTNEAVALARVAFHRLGYLPADSYVDASPKEFEIASSESGKKNSMLIAALSGTIWRKIKSQPMNIASNLMLICSGNGLLECPCFCPWTAPDHFPKLTLCRNWNRSIGNE